MSRCGPLLLAVTLAFGPAAHAAAPEPGMRMQDFVPPVYVAVRELVPGPEWERWLSSREGSQLLLPVSVWRGALGEVTRAHLGAGTSVMKGELRLDDSSLGVSLVDRLRSRCGTEQVECRIWLSGIWHGATDGAPAVLRLRAVHDPVEGTGPWAVSVIREPACLVIRVQKALHCARGPDRCDGCRKAAAGPSMPKLLDVCPEGDLARPVVTFTRGGKTEHRVYDVVRTFASLEEAKAFAAKHHVDVVE